MENQNSQLTLANKNLSMALDLEMNQPSGKIIQIGAVVGDVHTGEIYDSLSLYVDPEEPLAPRIIELTGITEETLDGAGYPLSVQYKVLKTAFSHWQCSRGLIVWGAGDCETLRGQTNADANWDFGRRYWDTKTLYQAWCRARNVPIQAGLARAMAKNGMPFKGHKHNALDDALNTFHFHRFMLKQFKGAVLK